MNLSATSILGITIFEVNALERSLKQKGDFMKMGKLILTTVAALNFFCSAAFAGEEQRAVVREFFCETEVGNEPLTLKAVLKTGRDLTYEVGGSGLSQLTEGVYSSYSETKRVYIYPGSLKIKTGRLRFKGTDPHDSFYLFLPGPFEKSEAIFTRDRMIVKPGFIKFERTDVTLNCH